jgi:pSer/pThr/pTyr-binding forkhead associated (FHA) protein
MTQKASQNQPKNNKNKGDKFQQEIQDAAAILPKLIENPEETLQVDRKNPPDSIDNPENTTNDLQGEARKALLLDAERRSAEEKASHLDKVRTIFTLEMILHLEIKESGRMISNRVEHDLIVGRADNITDYLPEVDMSEHGAYRLGLSRRHAIIQRDGKHLVVKDLNSRNGTFVNGAIVAGGTNHPIKDGDELRFGNLVTRVIFETPA